MKMIFTFLIAATLMNSGVLSAGEKTELKWKGFDAGFAEAKKKNKDEG